MHYVYLLSSATHEKIYTGVTSDLRSRLTEHNNGNVKYTKTGIPWKIIWYCAFNSKIKAYSFEKYLKSSSGYAFRNKRLI